MTRKMLLGIKQRVEQARATIEGTGEEVKPAVE